MSAATFQREVQVFIDKEIAPEVMTKRFSDYAEADVAKLIAAKRASPRWRRYVDGVEGAPPESVNVGGTIIYEFDYLADVTVFALTFLEARSPHRTGEFAHSFYLGLDGKFVPAARFNAATMGDVQEVVIGNIQPYTRKIDVQLVGTTRLRFSTPPGLFDDAAQAIRARFGNTVTAKRVYTMQFPAAYRLKTGKRAGRQVESPALVISRR